MIYHEIMFLDSLKSLALLKKKEQKFKQQKQLSQSGRAEWTEKPNQLIRKILAKKEICDSRNAKINPRKKSIIAKIDPNKVFSINIIID